MLGKGGNLPNEVWKQSHLLSLGKCLRFFLGSAQGWSEGQGAPLELSPTGKFVKQGEPQSGTPEPHQTGTHREILFYVSFITTSVISCPLNTR